MKRKVAAEAESVDPPELGMGSGPVPERSDVVARGYDIVSGDGVPVQTQCREPVRVGRTLRILAASLRRTYCRSYGQGSNWLHHSLNWEMT